MRKFLLLSLLSGLFLHVGAQDFTNKGKDFWIGYGNHVRMFNTGPAERMQLYITSDVNTTGVVDIPGISISFPFNITANQITTVDIPRSAALLTEGLYNLGIHVTAEKPVVVYSFIYVNSISGATLCLPTNTLGREYYSINYTQVSNEINSNSYFFAVATDTGTTTLEIIPAKNSIGGRIANVPFQVTLTRGQVYQVLSDTDLTGSIIRSVNNGSGCKKIAVFCGSGKISIGCTGVGTSDNLYQQMYPTSTWGKTYISVPSINIPSLSSQYNYIRIFKSDPAAVVKLNGGIIPSTSFVNGQYRDLGPSNEPNFIESDMPILVAQYFTTEGCSGNSGQGDPEMIYLNPVEQTIEKVTLNSMRPATNTVINQHFINVVLRNSQAAINSFKMDGISYPASFIPHPNAAGYAYAQIQVNQGTHNLTCDTAFNAIAYGFGAAESYGYSAGTNLKDLYQFLSVSNDYGTVNFAAGCKNSPFKFSMTYPYQPTQITWHFNGFFPDTTINNPIYDSTWIVNGRILYRYKLNKSFQLSSTGTYPISILANNPTPDGCSGVQEVEYELQIYESPVADFTFVNSGCVSDSVAFVDASDGLGRPVVRWNWSFGDGDTSALKNPKHKYTAGSFTVSHSAITDVGCISNTATKVVSLADPPVAKFGVSVPPCEEKVVTFTDSSSTTGGTLSKWEWDLDDGPLIEATNNSPIQHTYTTSGPRTVILKVKTSSGCESAPVSKDVFINALPDANFSLPSICLPNAGQFTDLSIISDGTQSLFTYEWDFGDGQTSAQKNPIHQYLTAQEYTVTLKVTSNNGCFDTTQKKLTTIYAQPKANFDVTPEVCIGAATQFTDKSDGKGSAVTQWRWNFGDAQSASTQNPVHTYGSVNTYNASLSAITDKGCVSDTFTKATIVNPLPTADFGFSAPTCETSQVNFFDASSANAGSLIKWKWNFGNGDSAAVQNPSSAYSTAGTYNASLVVESSKGCKSLSFNKPVKVNYRPLTNFGTPEVCLADPFAQFTDSSKIGDGTESQFSYLWRFNDPNANSGNPDSSNQKNPQHKYTAVGVYTIQLSVTSKDGCSATASKSFTVNGSIPQANFVVNAPTTICSNQDVTLNDGSTVDFGNIVKVEVYWDYNNDPAIKTVDDNPVPGKLYSHKYPGFGNPLTKNYQIRYIVYSGINCLSESSQTITVKASPEIEFNSLTPICEEIPSFAITGAREIYGLPGTGTFSGPGISANGIFNPLVATEGLHTIRYSFDASNGCSAFKEQTVQVNPTPTVDAGPDRTVLEGGFIILQGKGSGNNISYLWLPDIAIDDNTKSNPGVSATEDITYTLQVTSADGCSATDEVFVKLLKEPKVPNVFSPNGDGINDNWVIQFLDSYPGCTVDVYNRYGQVVFRSTGYDKPWDGAINGNPLPMGTYYWIINPKNGRKQMNGSVTILR